ncbi:MAG: GDP-mannose 4,6-dehydratase [Parcubacteria group bacterium Gr01-1014_33]|nr:MAG: GDP-mannose 4,6-dehydratase [Parcubacteria group bacterium Gr01-1014_33]
MDKKKRAFITGITGQDGSYLADFLLDKGYEVHGLVRRSSTLNRERLEHLTQTDGENPRQGIILHYGDLTDASMLGRLIEKINPHEVYNLGAQSHVGISFEMPVYTTEVVAMGTLKLLEAIRSTGIPTRFYQASSSEMFGNAPAPQSEETPFDPASPYGVAKVAAYNFTKNYREGHGMFAVNGILFNHESPRRGENFVTRKITLSIAQILAGKKQKIVLGNLDACRDWGYAPEYVEAMWRMMQQDQPDDYVIATGETHSVREFLENAFHMAGISDWQQFLEIDSRYHRPREVHLLVGDAAKAKKELRWEPKVKFQELIHIMLSSDCTREGISLPLHSQNLSVAATGGEKINQ